MSKTSFFKIGVTKGGEPFYNVQFSNGGGGCGLLKTMKPWDVLKFRALATHEAEHVKVYDEVLYAFEHGGDWKRIADDAVRQMVEEAK